MLDIITYPSQTINGEDHTVKKYYDETTGEELVPISLRDFMAKGMNKTDDYVLNNEPKNAQEKALKDKLVSEKTAKLRRELAALEKYLPKIASPTDETSDDDDKPKDHHWSDGTRIN